MPEHSQGKIQLVSDFVGPINLQHPYREIADYELDFISQKIGANEGITVPNQKQAQKCWQISFQANFMHQHIEAFKYQIKNLIESSLKLLNNDYENFKYFQTLNENQNQPKSLNKQENQQFKKVLLRFEKLQEFLQKIQDNTTEQITSQLKYLSYLVVKDYLKINELFYITQKQLIQKAQKYSKQNYLKLFKESEIKFLNLDSISKSQLYSDQRTQTAFQNFIQFYYTTVFLIMQGYFQNPYYHEQQTSPIRSRQYSIQQYLGDLISSASSIKYPRKDYL